MKAIVCKRNFEVTFKDFLSNDQEVRRIRKDGVTQDDYNLPYHYEEKYWKESKKKEKADKYKRNRKIINLVIFSVIALFLFGLGYDNNSNIVASILGGFFLAIVISGIFGKWIFIDVNEPTVKYDSQLINNYERYKSNTITVESLIESRKRKLKKTFLSKERALILEIESANRQNARDKKKIERELEKYQAHLHNKLTSLHPYDFEKYVEDHFKRKGFKTNLTKSTGDGGVDIKLKDETGRIIYVQCKRYKGSVSAPDVKQFLGTLIVDEIKKGFIVTTGKFSKNARQIANDNHIKLINGRELLDEGRDFYKEDKLYELKAVKLRHKRAKEKNFLSFFGRKNYKADEMKRILKDKCNEYKQLGGRYFGHSEIGNFIHKACSFLDDKYDDNLYEIFGPNFDRRRII